MGKVGSEFMPKTLLQWAQVISIIVGVTLVFISYFDKLDDRFANLDRRITHIEYKLEIKK